MASEIDGTLQIASSRGQRLCCGTIGWSQSASTPLDILHLLLGGTVCCIRCFPTSFLPLSPGLDALAYLLRAWSFSPQFGDVRPCQWKCTQYRLRSEN